MTNPDAPLPDTLADWLAHCERQHPKGQQGIILGLERVREVAQQYGYSFNVSARNLKLRRSMTVAVVVEMKPTVERQMSGPYPLDLLGGITQELTSTGYSVLLTSLQGGSLPNVQAADGVILLGQGAHEDAMHEVQRWGRPVGVWGAVSGR